MLTLCNRIVIFGISLDVLISAKIHIFGILFNILVFIIPNISKEIDLTITFNGLLNNIFIYPSVKQLQIWH